MTPSPSAGLTVDRVSELRRWYSYRAYGESRDENDEKAQEYADIATLCDAWLAYLGDVNLMHWKVGASGVVACVVISYGLLVAIFGRWAP